MFRFRLRRRNIIDAVQADQDYMGLCVRVGFQSVIFNGVTCFENKLSDMFRTENSENTKSYCVGKKFDKCQPISRFHRITTNQRSTVVATCLYRDR